MELQLYTPENQGLSELEQLKSLIRGGPSELAARGTEYTLSDGVRVRPAQQFIRFDKEQGALSILVTVVFNARNAGSVLNISADSNENVMRILRARVNEYDACILLSGNTKPRENQFREAARQILTSVLDLGLASESTVVVSSLDDDIGFGSPMFDVSHVFVATVGFVMIQTSESADRARVDPAEVSRMNVQTLFEGGEWAVQRDTGDAYKDIYIADPPLTIRVHAKNQEDEQSRMNTCVSVVANDEVQLIAVYARRDARFMLLASGWGHTDDREKALVLMEQHADFDSEMVIFVTPYVGINTEESAWRTMMLRVLRSLYDLKLTAKQKRTDALVIIHDGVGARMEVTSLLDLIDEIHVDPVRLKKREMGLKLNAKKRRILTK
jgi:hypothetical protein